MTHKQLPMQLTTLALRRITNVVKAVNSDSLKRCKRPILTSTKTFSTQRNRLCSRCFSSSKQLQTTLSLEQFQERGLVEQVYPSTRLDELPEFLSRPQGMYCGFDPTADSLHIGNLISILVLLHGQRAGHYPIIVIGGATGMIGDPSGKNSERVAMLAEDVEKNAVKLTENVNRIFHNHAEYIHKDKSSLNPHRVLNNADWYKNLNIIQFMSTTGRYFRLGQMLSKQSVKSRLEAPRGGMSLTEFMYQAFQGSDWLHLFNEYDCGIQVGGNDQTGNIASGFELIRDVTEKFTYGLLVPLLLDEKGRKLGKSTGNSVWLDPHKSSPFDMYQYFFNMSDANVERFLKLLTFLTKEEIESVMLEQQKDSSKRYGQKKVAQEVTLLVHGESGLNAAVLSTEVLFGSDPITSLKKMSFEDLQQLFGKSSTAYLKFDSQMSIFELCDIIAPMTGFGGFKQKGKDGLKDRILDLIKSGGFYINQQRVNNPDAVLGDGNYVLHNDVTLIRLGKKNYTLVSWQL